MKSLLKSLNIEHLKSLCSDLQSSNEPLLKSQLADIMPSILVDELFSELSKLSNAGVPNHVIAQFLEIVIDEREKFRITQDGIRLVWTGQAVNSHDFKNTKMVVDDCFKQAKRRVLISTFSLDSHDKARAIFGDLADRYDNEEGLEVICFININRNKKDQREDEDIVSAFTERFRKWIWPGKKMPKVYYDPRSLAKFSAKQRACLHAKCVIIDEEKLFLTSANFSEAAHGRNIEAGIIIDQGQTAKQLDDHFKALIDSNTVVKLDV